MGVEGEDLERGKILSLRGHVLAGVMPLEKRIPQTLRKSAREVHIDMLERAVSTLVSPHKRGAEGEL